MGYSDGKEALFRYNKREELVELTDWNGTAAVTEGEEEPPGIHTTRQESSLPWPSPAAPPYTATMPADFL